VREFEDAQHQLMADASPELKRFLSGLRDWIGGSREWHRNSGRYRIAPLLPAA
jgi:2-methylisoborneol synthase